MENLPKLTLPISRSTLVPKRTPSSMVKFVLNANSPTISTSRPIDATLVSTAINLVRKKRNAFHRKRFRASKITI